MNKEINARMDLLLKDILDDYRLDETFALKLRAIADLMKAETSRVDQGGEPDRKAYLTFARICDRFSAQLLELGAPSDVCEEFNAISNKVRKSALKPS